MVIVRVCCWSNGIIIDPNIRNSSMRILGKSHFGIITTAGILLLNIRIIRCTLRVIPTVLGGMRPGTIFPSWMRCNYKTSRTYLDFLRNSPCPWIPACLLASAKKQSTYAIQNDLTYEHKSLKSLNAYLREILYIELR